LRTRQRFDARDVVGLDVESALDRRDRLLVQGDDDARQRPPVAAVAAARHASMLSGTSCRLSVRFCAVTMTLSRTPSLLVSAAQAGCRVAATAAASDMPAIFRWVRCESRLSLRCRLRVIGVSPKVSLCNAV